MAYCYLTLFDRISLANSAVERAKQVAACDGQRFQGEYETARAWSLSVAWRDGDREYPRL